MDDSILINPDDAQDPFHDGMGFARPEDLPPRRSRVLTSQQQASRARRIAEEHDRTKGRPVIMPSHDQLQGMSDEQRKYMADGLKQLKQQLELGRTVVGSDVAVQPVLPFAENE